MGEGYPYGVDRWWGSSDLVGMKKVLVDDENVIPPSSSLSPQGKSTNIPDRAIREWLWKGVGGLISHAIINLTQRKKVHIQ
ncbi:MAG: hypothetical protein PVF83_11990 [Anaerolineales bacterium]|jgi:hypothetical protein